MEEFIKYFSVYALSGLKFIFGPTLGLSYGFSITVTALLTACGMMTTVYVFTFFGNQLRWLIDRFKKKDRKLFSRRNRRFVKIWRRYGVMGLAMVTPVLLMPVGGALLVNLFGGKRKKIIFWMWVSALSHSFVQTWLFKEGFGLIKTILDTQGHA